MESFPDPYQNHFFHANTLEGKALASNARPPFDEARQRHNVDQFYVSYSDVKGPSQESDDPREHGEHQLMDQRPQHPGGADPVGQTLDHSAQICEAQGDVVLAASTPTMSPGMPSEATSQLGASLGEAQPWQTQPLQQNSEGRVPELAAFGGSSSLSAQPKPGPVAMTASRQESGHAQRGRNTAQDRTAPSSANDENAGPMRMGTGARNRTGQSPQFAAADAWVGGHSNQAAKTTGTSSRIPAPVISFYQAQIPTSTQVFNAHLGGVGGPFGNHEHSRTMQAIAGEQANANFDLPGGQKGAKSLAETVLQNLPKVREEQRQAARVRGQQQAMQQVERIANSFPPYAMASGTLGMAGLPVADANVRGKGLQVLVNDTMGKPLQGARSYSLSHANSKSVKGQRQRHSPYHQANTSPEVVPGLRANAVAGATHVMSKYAGPVYKIEKINELQNPGGRNTHPFGIPMARASNSTTGQGRVAATAGASAGTLNTLKRDRVHTLGSPHQQSRRLQEDIRCAGRRYNNTVQDHVSRTHAGKQKWQLQLMQVERPQRMQFPSSSPPTVTAMSRKHQKQVQLSQLLSASNLANGHVHQGQRNTILSNKWPHYGVYPSAGGGPMDLGKRGQHGTTMPRPAAQTITSTTASKQQRAGPVTLAQIRPQQQLQRATAVGGHGQLGDQPDKAAAHFQDGGAERQQRQEEPRPTHSSKQPWNQRGHPAATASVATAEQNKHYRDDSFGPSPIGPSTEAQKGAAGRQSNSRGSSAEAKVTPGNAANARAFFGQISSQQKRVGPEQRPCTDASSASPGLSAFQANLFGQKVDRQVHEASSGFKNQQEKRTTSKKKTQAQKDQPENQESKGSDLHIIAAKSGPEEGMFTGLAYQFSSGERKHEDEERSRGQDGSLKAPATSADKHRKGEDSGKRKKHIVYKNPKVKIGNGKLGPVDLIIYKDDLHALKRVPKQQIDKPKRIEHLKNEKFILLMLKRLHDDFKTGKYNKYSANDHSAQKQLLYDDFNGSRDNNSPSQQQNNESTGTSYRNSYNIDEMQIFNDMQHSKSAHPLPLNYIVRLEETFSDAENVNFIFEYLPGQSLHWVIQNQMHMKLGKEDKSKWVKFYASQVLCGLETLQRYNIIYRDIKPENMMIDREGLIKIIDFGFAKILRPQNQFRTSTNCGTVGYTAPELLVGIHNGYSFLVDVWSFGILICELLQGKLPYECQDDPIEIQKQCVQGDIKLPRDIDQATCDLLQCILVVDPNQRITIKDIMRKAFFREVNWERIRAREISAADGDYIPYKPNPNKFRYLLQNQYEEISNLGKPGAAGHSDAPNSPLSPAPASDKKRDHLTLNDKGVKQPHSPQTTPKKNLLGDYTMRKVNREFEDF